MSDRKYDVADTNRAVHMRPLAGLDTHTQNWFCGAVASFHRLRDGVHIATGAPAEEYGPLRPPGRSRSAESSAPAAGG
jgi:hypothetical protein